MPKKIATANKSSEQLISKKLYGLKFKTFLASSPAHRSKSLGILSPGRTLSWTALLLCMLLTTALSAAIRHMVQRTDLHTSMHTFMHTMLPISTPSFAHSFDHPFAQRLAHSFGHILADTSAHSYAFSLAHNAALIPAHGSAHRFAHRCTHKWSEKWCKSDGAVYSSLFSVFPADTALSLMRRSGFPDSVSILEQTFIWRHPMLAPRHVVTKVQAQHNEKFCLTGFSQAHGQYKHTHRRKALIRSLKPAHQAQRDV